MNLINIIKIKRTLTQRDIDGKTKCKSVSNIMEIICNVVNIPLDVIDSDSRKTEIVTARHFFCFFMKIHTTFSLASIGMLINRDHSSVSHSINKIKSDMPFNKEYQRIHDVIDLLLG